MKDSKGCCIYCGQIKMVQVPDSFTQEQIIEEVTNQCNCEEAKAHQFKQLEEELKEQSKLTAQGMIIELFKEQFPEVAELLQKAIIPLAEFRFDKLTIKIDDTTTAHISINSKGEIKVERIDKRKYTRVTDR